jgi:hypothetical protein
VQSAYGRLTSILVKNPSISLSSKNGSVAATAWPHAASALTDAVAAGDITPGEAASLSMLVGNVAKAVETVELSERLAKFEEQMAAKGGTP